MDVVKVSWSGGKDSTCSVYLHTLKSHFCKIVCYIPMFTADIPLIQKSHFDFIISTSELFKSWGHEVYLVSGLSYFDYVTHISKKGKFKGQIFGFPCIKRGCCGFKRDSKLKSLLSCDVGFFDYEDIGIAFDEVSRSKILSDSKRSILFEQRVSESDAFRICSENNILSPIYKTSFRDGCVLCPFSKSFEREQWFLDFPDARKILLDLQYLVRSERPDRAPLPNYQYFL